MREGNAKSATVYVCSQGWNPVSRLDAWCNTMLGSMSKFEVWIVVY
jgi:hypothetical protein